MLEKAPPEGIVLIPVNADHSKGMIMAASYGRNYRINGDTEYISQIKINLPDRIYWRQANFGGSIGLKYFCQLRVVAAGADGLICDYYFNVIIPGQMLSNDYYTFKVYKEDGYYQYPQINFFDWYTENSGFFITEKWYSIPAVRGLTVEEAYSFTVSALNENSASGSKWSDTYTQNMVLKYSRQYNDQEIGAPRIRFADNTAYEYSTGVISWRKDINPTSVSGQYPGIEHVNYIAHLVGTGWNQGWKKDGETAGTTGEKRRMEAIKISLGSLPPGVHINYMAHLAGIGWMEKRW